MKIVCVGQNYRAHSKEMGGDPNAEAELAVVIGQSARRISQERALDAVAGYACANDVSARDLQYGDGQWFRGKNFATFCPIWPLHDPVPVSELGDGSGLRVMQVLNGETIQDGNTEDLIFSVPYLVAFASTLFTLEPGDVVLTGTPAGVGWAREPKLSLKDGDTVEVIVAGIGTLSNPVVRES